MIHLPEDEMRNRIEPTDEGRFTKKPIERINIESNIYHEEGSMAYNGFGIDAYLDAAAVTQQLDELIKMPMYGIMPDALQMYEEEYFGKKCAGRSSVADPDGRIVARASEEECSVYHILDMDFQEHMREVNPSYDNRRPDLYDI